MPETNGRGAVPATARTTRPPAPPAPPAYTEGAGSAVGSADRAPLDEQIAERARELPLSWELLRELEHRFGDSFYVLDLDAVRRNYGEFRDAFRRHYPNTSIAYSYKTNYTPRLCRAVNALGGYAEVVSRMEFDLAVGVGVDPRRIIFNGPYKTASDLEAALLSGSIVNVDSPSEVALVEGIARGAPQRTVRVGVRCAFDVGDARISRFGFDVEGDAFVHARETLGRIDNLDLIGLHCHYSGQRSVASHARRAATMLELTARCFGGVAPPIINLGGGFFGKLPAELVAQFPTALPTYQDYADAIAPQVAAAYPDSPAPELMLEPGSAMVADAMRFVAKVVDVKRVRARVVALVSGSVHNIKPTLHDKRLPMRVYRPQGGASTGTIADDGPVDVVGYTCMEPDCLYPNHPGPLAPGDYVVFENVGAYTTVMKPPFIRPSPAIVAFDSASGGPEEARRAEAMADMFATYSA